MPLTEDEEQRYGRNKNTVINYGYINSGKYRRKFDAISDSPQLNRLLYRLSKKMLQHRSGTMYEDMYWIDPDKIKVIAEETESNFERKIIYTENVWSKIKTCKNLITLHSHPNSFPPSVKDLNSNYYNDYALGVIACHDGKVFVYSSGQEINEDYYKLKVEKYRKSGYNDYEAQTSALNELQEMFQIRVKEVCDYDV